MTPPDTPVDAAPHAVPRPSAPLPVEAVDDEAADPSAPLVPATSWELTFEEFREANAAHAAETVRGGRTRWGKGYLLVMAVLFALLLLAAGQGATGAGRAAAYLRFGTTHAALGLMAAAVVGVPLLAGRGTRALLVGLAAMMAAFVAVVLAGYLSGVKPWPPDRSEVAFTVVGVLVWGNYLRFALGGGAVRKVWDGQPHLHDRTSLRVTAEGVELDAPLSRVLTRWPAVESWQSTGRVFVLRLSRYSMLIVPRRAWPDPAGAEAFAAVLRDRAGRRTGFEVVRAGDGGPASGADAG